MNLLGVLLGMGGMLFALVSYSMAATVMGQILGVMFALFGSIWLVGAGIIDAVATAQKRIEAAVESAAKAQLGMMRVTSIPAEPAKPPGDGS